MASGGSSAKGGIRGQDSQILQRERGPWSRKLPFGTLGGTGMRKRELLSSTALALILLLGCGSDPALASEPDTQGAAGAAGNGASGSPMPIGTGGDSASGAG